MLGDSFAFAIRVGREVDPIRIPRGEILQFGHHVFFPWNDDVRGLEVVLNVDAKLALRQSSTCPSDASTVKPRQYF